MKSKNNDKNIEMIRRTSPFAIIFICLVLCLAGFGFLAYGLSPVKIICHYKNCSVKEPLFYEIKTINNVIKVDNYIEGIKPAWSTYVVLINDKDDYLKIGNGFFLNYFFRQAIIKDISRYLDSGSSSFEGSYRDYISGILSVIFFLFAYGLYKLRFGKRRPPNIV